MRLFTDADFERAPRAAEGLHRTRTIPGAAVVVADPSVAAPIAWVTGANEVDHHVRGAVLGRDFARRRVGRPRARSSPGDPCPRCGAAALGRPRHRGRARLPDRHQVLRRARAHYTDEHGEQHPMVMGCYGIGVSRVVAAVVEEHHDDHGIAWPAALAPYRRAPRGAARPRRAGRATCSSRPSGMYDEPQRSGTRRALRRPRREPRREVRRRRPASACRCSSSSARRASAKGIVERKDRATGTRRRATRRRSVVQCRLRCRGYSGGRVPAS